jgi:membrane protein involved in colicin uptake
MRIAELSAANILQLAENGKGGRLKNLAVDTCLCSSICEFRVQDRRRAAREEEIRREQQRLEEIRRLEEAERIKQEEYENAILLAQQKIEAEKQKKEAQRIAFQEAEKQRRINREAAEEKWKKALEKHRSASAQKKATKKDKAITHPPPTQHETHPVAEPCKKRPRKTYNIGSFGYFPPDSRPFIELCHHGVSRRRVCEFCAASDDEYNAGSE